MQIIVLHEMSQQTGVHQQSQSSRFLSGLLSPPEYCAVFPEKFSEVGKPRLPLQIDQRSTHRNAKFERST